MPEQKEDKKGKGLAVCASGGQSQIIANGKKKHGRQGRNANKTEEEEERGQERKRERVGRKGPVLLRTPSSGARARPDAFPARFV